MNGIKNYLVQHGETQLNDIIELERGKVGNLTVYLGPRLHQRQRQCCNNSAMMLAIMFSLKTMELLQKGVATHF